VYRSAHDGQRRIKKGGALMPAMKKLDKNIARESIATACGI
jgi:hypothetical protein